jgi:hypothetical protein
LIDFESFGCAFYNWKSLFDQFGTLHMFFPYPNSRTYRPSTSILFNNSLGSTSMYVQINYVLTSILAHWVTGFKILWLIFQNLCENDE